MTDVTVTDEMVEIAARALYASAMRNAGAFGDIQPWDDLIWPEQKKYRHSARAALAAALPMVVAGERARLMRDMHRVALYQQRDLGQFDPYETAPFIEDYSENRLGIEAADLRRARMHDPANDAPADPEGGDES